LQKVIDDISEATMALDIAENTYLQEDLNPFNKPNGYNSYHMELCKFYRS